MSSQLLLSPDDPRPMYQQIVDQITARVMAGDWAPGSSLPSIRELAADSQVSVITVRRAYEELERAGVIATRQGRGSVVAEQRALPTRLMQEELARAIEALLVCAGRLGLSPEAVLQQVAQALEEGGKPPAPTHRSTGDSR
ncbi:GntR family transcriptional regulator [Pseudomarimonas salicorniae]|uniref:GntR family transcriptional regulator n=1 Tax=Pseudomarimonas salicorniae TaxID=2933270 RepID=A0ABT0GLG2_9GAMM|nr:GntR family transcriptional regulator [Lysobacter sp. CAU 1642]MCK7595351.1 GntR family transcriptional regulator [Lysobacter sp. CAU 1642]